MSMKELIQQDTEISDAELMASFAGGRANAMELLIARYQQPLFAWLMGMTQNRADAEDLFQEVWIRIIKNAEGFKNISFKAWMWRIARNLLIDFRRRKRPNISLDAVAESGDDRPLVERLESGDMGPAATLEQSDMLEMVMEAVERLPEMQREVFLLRTQGNLAFREIAELLDIPLNTALGRMHDAMRKLKESLARMEEEL